MNNESIIKNRNKGIILLIMSAFGFAMMATFIKLCPEIPSFQKIFFRNSVSLIVASIAIIQHKKRFFAKKENQKLLLLRCTLGTLGIMFNFYCIDRMVLSDANMLNKLSPFFIVVFSAIFLHERIKLNQLLSVVVAFVGALFIIKPSFSFDVVPALVGTLGGICAAAAYTCIRALRGREDAETIVFFFSFFSCIVTLPVTIITYTPMSLVQFTYLVLSGVFASIGQFGITLAYKYAPAKEISIFDYSNIIFSAIISLIVFDMLPDYYSVFGYLIIFVSSFYMYIYNRKLDS